MGRVTGVIGIADRLITSQALTSEALTPNSLYPDPPKGLGFRVAQSLNFKW